MRRAKPVSKARSIAVALFLAIVAIPVRSALAQTNWRDMRQSDFPARVKAIVGLPATMDAQNCATWGRWEVCFTGELPIARFHFVVVPGNPREDTLSIAFPLQCKNPVVGRTGCEMHLFYQPNKRWERCFLQGKDLPPIVPGEPQHGGLLDIRCPSGLVLE